MDPRRWMKLYFSRALTSTPGLEKVPVSLAGRSRDHALRTCSPPRDPFLALLRPIVFIPRFFLRVWVRGFPSPPRFVRGKLQVSMLLYTRCRVAAAFESLPPLCASSSTRLYLQVLQLVVLYRWQTQPRTAVPLTEREKPRGRTAEAVEEKSTPMAARITFPRIIAM